MRTLVLAALLLAPLPASAFCGFFVSGAGESMYANATMVVMMREGTRTILSMQNNYQGPPQDFAMVIPVPVVLQKENVKTLPKEVFSHVDTLAAPRLVEYWEQDPCWVPPPMAMRIGGVVPMMGPSSTGGGARKDLGVTVEAQFSVGEYDVVILSAKDSGGLEKWLKLEKYNIPAGAGEVLRPYVESGTRFFVAKVDVDRVTFEGDRALLSPLRFHYDSERFDLPVRLGLLNSQGVQDLIVHILAPGARYEVANYRNVQIPTNLIAGNDVREDFGAYYEDIFREAIWGKPDTVVTEYAWDSSSCDPCPTPPLTPQDLLSLGADVLPGQPTNGMVLTRLHYRYTAETLGEDLIFRKADGLQGGVGIPDQGGKLVSAPVVQGSWNMFQGRYVMLNPWTGPITCDNPMRGRWGGPPSGGDARPVPAENKLLRGGAVPALAPPTRSRTGNPAFPDTRPASGAGTIPEVGGTPSTIPEVGGTPSTIPEVGGSTPTSSPPPSAAEEQPRCATTSGAAFSLLGIVAGLFASRRRRA
jgi:hypothetical protein